MHGLRLGLSWVLALAMAGLLLWISDGMLFPAPGKNLLFPTIAEQSGIALFEPTGRFAIAMTQVLAALLLLLPFTRLAGAFLAFAIGGGAVATHFLWLQGRVAAGATGADMGSLLYLAGAVALGALILAFVHPGEEPAY